MIRIIKQYSTEEYERIRRMALERQGSKDVAGIRDGRMVQNGTEAHLLGLAGEMAVAQLFGGKLDEQSRLGGDDGAPDVALPDGSTVNVKTRAEQGYAFLLTPGHRTLGADYGALCWRLKPTPQHPLSVEIAGIIETEDFDACCELMDYGHGQRIWVRPQLMRRRLRP